MSVRWMVTSGDRFLDLHVLVSTSRAERANRIDKQACVISLVVMIPRCNEVARVRFPDDAFLVLDRNAPKSARRARAPAVPHEYLTVAQLVERGTVNVYSGDP